MARAARSTHARKKRRKVLEQARGYRGQKSRSYKKAKEQVWKSGVYAYEGRKQRKRRLNTETLVTRADEKRIKRLLGMS